MAWPAPRSSFWYCAAMPVPWDTGPALFVWKESKTVKGEKSIRPQRDAEAVARLQAAAVVAQRWTVREPNVAK